MASSKQPVTEQAINYYDDKNHFYEDFWTGRDYEHQAEIVALNRLLKGSHFNTVADLGGGYGRVDGTLLEYADHVYLIDPSTKQLDIGKRKFGKNPAMHYVLMEHNDVIPMDTASTDLLVMIRVSHHLVDPMPTFKEINRVLRPGGRAIIEIANNKHFVNRLRHYARLQAVPKAPVPVGKKANGITDETPFVNHNPSTITKQLMASDFKIIRKLSVSNLRSAKLKKNLSLSTMLAVEKKAQTVLAPSYFGPSIFFYVEKTN